MKRLERSVYLHHSRNHFHPGSHHSHNLHHKPTPEPYRLQSGSHSWTAQCHNLPPQLGTLGIEYTCAAPRISSPIQAGNQPNNQFYLSRKSSIWQTCSFSVLVCIAWPPRVMNFSLLFLLVTSAHRVFSFHSFLHCFSHGINVPFLFSQENSNSICHAWRVSEIVNYMQEAFRQLNKLDTLI